MKTWLIGLSLFVLTGPSEDFWTVQESGTRARLRGVSVVGNDVAWASGSGGTCLRSVDGGTTWTPVVVPDSSGLDFRDVQGFDARTASLLSIGPGPLSRIYRTTDAGATWTLQHTNADPQGFLDALAFWDPDHGLVLGDPVDGRFEIRRTSDGGRTWSKVPAASIPEALPGEGAFAASGTCLVVQGSNHAWFGTGGGASSRVFRTSDRGQTWSVATTPIRAGVPSAGIFSLAFLDSRQGVAVGGDYKSEADPTANLALTFDGGQTWVEGGKMRPSGFRSAVAYEPGSLGPSLIAVGPSGSDRSADGGQTWTRISDLGFHALGLGGSRPSAWAVGEKGRVARLAPPPPNR